ncbi:hypothetical protein [Alicyclobacillus acidoterrestris]|uniref:Uncharacterized protein n=1 Tax=Alicyclobacillus acidoterrestris (strain ATCC 49025 / DSM 3922 / CIP 106132 / NCIMB 13137 / GD3B) TaxID=1356854 RepID=T0D890_ALIAG|nr:hypothetical protein [Alicyclobacillus acidoterrestris]EPZ47727.1 hypothetical protein N007_05590 [Alicyclobacillus acidoterrestris ATCC 49025]UNO47964.1 hypothetical protein K1I37_14920 [Alicyclobacillus acidoterrestris]
MERDALLRILGDLLFALDDADTRYVGYINSLIVETKKAIYLMDTESGAIESGTQTG